MRLDTIPSGCNGKVKGIKAVIYYLTSEGLFGHCEGVAYNCAENFDDFLLAIYDLDVLLKSSRRLSIQDDCI